LDHGVQFIEKPFSKKDLATKIRNVLNGLEVQWR
jgi:FixJ family two-component response regulator